jgi:hypothetical protein
MFVEMARRGLTVPRAGIESPPSFREFVSRVNPRYRWYRHCEVLAGVLQRVADGEIDRLLIFMPPRHGKSECVSRLFSAYYLSRFPDRWVGVNSYGADLAYTLSRSARENYARFGGTISGDSSAVKHWETGRGGGLWAAGVGGPITGKGWSLGIIDDPLKNAEEANSPLIRAKHKEWYGSTFYTREEPGGAIIGVMTRWHEDDLFGWLLEESTRGGDEWFVISMPAVGDDEGGSYHFDLVVPDRLAASRGLSEGDRLASVDECFAGRVE